jgi:acyl carrier protein
MNQNEKIRATIISFLVEANAGRDCSNVRDDADLLEAGLLDSLRFLDLILFLEKEFDKELDFLDADVGELSTIGGICAHLATIGSKPDQA